MYYIYFNTLHTIKIKQLMHTKRNDKCIRHIILLRKKYISHDKRYNEQ